jgi:hypothetical protein
MENGAVVAEADELAAFGAVDATSEFDPFQLNRIRLQLLV